MAIYNPNYIQKGINQPLTSYTDQYVKNALANLGQRTSIKGDGITSDSFYMSELFPDYLGNLNEEGLCANFTVDFTSDNIVSAEIMKWVYDEKSDSWSFSHIGESGTAETQYGFKVRNVGSNVYDVSEDSSFEGTSITITGGTKINNTDSYDSKGAVISKNEDSYIYKLKSRFLGDIKELIFEEVTNSGEMISGLRIYQVDENDKTNSNLKVLYLAKNQDVLTLKKRPYILEEFSITNVELFGGSTKEEILSNIYLYLIGQNESDMELKRYDSPDIIMSALQTSELVTLNNRWLIDYDTERNLYFSIPTDSAIKPSDMVVNRLEYFTDDIRSLYPRIREVYNEIKYADHLKLYRNLISDLLTGPIYEDLITQYGLYDSTGEGFNRFIVTFPLDFKISYNVNDHDSVIIYNTTSSLNTLYINNFYSGDLDKEIIDLGLIEKIKNISNNIFDDEGLPSNKNYLIVHGYEDKTALYDFDITYIEDSIIDKIRWVETFSMPYVNADGYWVVNGIVTDVYAYGRDAQMTRFVILQSERTSPEYVIEDHTASSDMSAYIMSDPYDLTSIVPMSRWEEYPIKVPFLTSASDKIDDTNYYNMVAYLPGEEAINEIAGETSFTYLQSSVFVNFLNPACEVDTWEEVDRQPYDIEGYEPVVDDNGVTVFVKYAPKGSALASKIGTAGPITTFWMLGYDEEKSKWEFRYLSRPGSDYAIDMTYMTNLEKLVKFNMATALEPDNYEHSWLVFDELNKNYKNNTATGDENQTLFPVIMNHLSDYYISDFGDRSSEASETALVENIYSNQSNLSVQFYNNVQRDDNGLISYVGQASGSGPYWSLFMNDVTYSVAKTPDDHYLYNPDTQKHQFLTYCIETYPTNSYGILSAIFDSRFHNEWYPNAIQDSNGDQQKFPILDLSEVLVKDHNTLNRMNVLTVGKETTQAGATIYPMYYSYFGASFEDPDKSHLHIGTSNIDPNLGTKTQIDRNSTETLNRTKVLDIDMDVISMNGDLEINKNANIKGTIWRVSEIEIPGSPEIMNVYSTIVNPVGVLHEETVRPSDMTYAKIPADGVGMTIPGWNSDRNSPEYLLRTYSSYQRWNPAAVFRNSYAHLLNSISFEDPYFEVSPTRRVTRYLNAPANLTRRVSYLNLSKLFDDNHMFQNTYFHVTSDAQLTYHTYRLDNRDTEHWTNTPTDKYRLSYYMQLSTDLTDQENLLMENRVWDLNAEDGKVVVSNPIEISYTKKKLNAYIYKDVLTTYYSYLWPISYTERWSCPGCELCSYENCKAILSCKFSECQGWVTYRYGQCTQDQLAYVKPREFKVARLRTTVDSTGIVTKMPTEVSLFYPNPYSRYMSNTTEQLENGQYTYIDENGFRVTQATDPGIRPGYMWSGKIEFSQTYMQAYNALVARFPESTYTWTQEYNGWTDDDGSRKNKYTYKITYIEKDDKDKKVHYVVYPYTIYENDKKVTYYLQDADGKVRMSNQHIKKSSNSVQVEYTFDYRSNTEKIHTYTYAYYVNVRELRSMHTEPYVDNAISSLASKSNENAAISTNQYQHQKMS